MTVKDALVMVSPNNSTENALDSATMTDMSCLRRQREWQQPRPLAHTHTHTHTQHRTTRVACKVAVAHGECNVGFVSAGIKSDRHATCGMQAVREASVTCLHTTNNTLRTPQLHTKATTRARATTTAQLVTQPQSAPSWPVTLQP